MEVGTGKNFSSGQVQKLFSERPAFDSSSRSKNFVNRNKTSFR